MTLNELNRVAFATLVTKKKKGRNKGYKYTYSTVWSGAMTPNEYLRQRDAIDRREGGLFRCRIEWDNFTYCKWWDVPSYRDEAIRDYRERIKAIRMEYGLTRAEVAPYMRVS